MNVFLLIEYILMWFFGASLASFYGVVAMRVPMGKSIVRPSSHCDSCGTNLDGIQLIPVVGYLVYRGKCKHCDSKVPIFFPAVEFFFGVFALALYIKYGINFYEHWGYFESLLIVSLLLITALSDMFYRKILNVIMIILFAVALYINIVTDVKELGLRLVASLATIIIFLVIGRWEYKGLGLGDVKLYSIIVILLGLYNTCLVLFAASFLAIIYTLLNKNARANLRKYKIPFGFYTSLVVICFYIDKLFY